MSCSTCGVDGSHICAQPQAPKPAPKDKGGVFTQIRIKEEHVYDPVSKTWGWKEVPMNSPED